MACKLYIAAIFLIIELFHITEVQSIGICYRRDDGTNLHFSETDVVNLCKRNGITGIRVYAVNSQILDALRGSNLDVVVDIPNPRLQELNDPARANDWGIKATTQTYSMVVKNLYPPSSGEFKYDAKGIMIPPVRFLAKNRSPLLASLYPYFSRVADPDNITLSYALFTNIVRNSAGYWNLFDALYDAMYAAVQKAMPPQAARTENAATDHSPDLEIYQNGWPSGGGPQYPDASPENAATYYTNLIAHVNSNVGTPLRPGRPIETYLFAMFDKDKKPGKEKERHFGLFRPDLTQKYGLSFN